ncbi:acetaldehyde dehydrogenase [Pycnococcus provasolii]
MRSGELLKLQRETSKAILSHLIYDMEEKESEATVRYEGDSAAYRLWERAVISATEGIDYDNLERIIKYDEIDEYGDEDWNLWYTPKDRRFLYRVLMDTLSPAAKDWTSCDVMPELDNSKPPLFAEQRRLRVGILGTGNIGCDLLIKLLKTNFAEVIVFAGRRHNSPGLELGRRLQVPCTELGIEYLIDKPDCCDLVFDCTSAASAISHAATLKTLNIKVVDLTPAKLGVICVPVINAEVALSHDNINMITCGGQAILPLLHCIVTETANVEYVEVVSQIASASAGMSTRANIDNYIHTTEAAIQHFTNVHACKAVLNLNPAVPEVDMQTTAFLRYSSPSFDIDHLAKALEDRINHIRRVRCLTRFDHDVNIVTGHSLAIEINTCVKFETKRWLA